MISVSIQDVAIIRAHKAKTLEIKEVSGRFGTYAYIADDKGIIECFDDTDEAQAAVETALMMKGTN